VEAEMEAKMRSCSDMASQQMMYQQMVEAKKDGMRSLEETQVRLAMTQGLAGVHLSRFPLPHPPFNIV
jgi:hypothetical protein